MSFGQPPRRLRTYLQMIWVGGEFVDREAIQVVKLIRRRVLARLVQQTHQLQLRLLVALHQLFSFGCPLLCRGQQLRLIRTRAVDAGLRRRGRRYPESMRATQSARGSTARGGRVGNGCRASRWRRPLASGEAPASGECRRAACPGSSRKFVGSPARDG